MRALIGFPPHEMGIEDLLSALASRAPSRTAKLSQS